MSEKPAVYEVDAKTIEQVIIGGDLAALSPAQRVNYYQAVCRSLGLNPLTKPFDYIRLNNRLVLYARKDATDQLRNRDNISIEPPLEKEMIQSTYVVTAVASTPDGRKDVATGAVCIEGLSGDALANAMMKTETKAKRRVTLSICGLGWLDESEIETVPEGEVVQVDESGEISEKAAETAVLPKATARPVVEQPAPVPGGKNLVVPIDAESHGRWWPNLVKAAEAFGYKGHNHVVATLSIKKWDPAAMDWEHREQIRAALKEWQEQAKKDVTDLYGEDAKDG